MRTKGNGGGPNLQKYEHTGRGSDIRLRRKEDHANRESTKSAHDDANAAGTQGGDGGKDDEEKGTTEDGRQRNTD